MIWFVQIEHRSGTLLPERDNPLTGLRRQEMIGSHRSKRIATHIAASILFGSGAHPSIWLASTQVSGLPLAYRSRLDVESPHRRTSTAAAISILAGAVVRLPHFVNLWLGPKSSDTAVPPKNPRHLRIDWRFLLIQGLPALLLMEFPSFVLVIGWAIGGRPLVWLLFEVRVVMGLGEFVFNSLAAFWLGGTLLDALEFVE